MIAVLASRLTAEIHLQPGFEAARVERTVSVRANSVVFFANLGVGTGQPAAIKCCRVPGTDIADPVAAQAQFDALRRVHESLLRVSPRFTVPAPLWLGANLGAYAMSWVVGQSLTEQLGQWGRADSLMTAFESAGAWLGAFHSSGPLQYRPADIEGKAEHLRKMAKQPVSHPLFQQGLERLTRAYPRMQALPLQCSWLHGDCKTDNFMLTSDGVCGIDIALSDVNAVEHDLAQFLNHLELQTSGLRLMHRRQDHTALSQAFLQGYRSTGPTLDDAFLYWMRLWSALSFWHARVVETRPSVLKRGALNYLFSALVGSLLKSPDVRLIYCAPP